MPQEVASNEAARASLRSTVQRLSSANHDLILPKPRPPSPLHAALAWWASWAIPGMGMFSEAYMIFSIGNIKPLLEITYPHCFGTSTPSDCNQRAAAQVTSAEVCGIITGMLLLGVIADWIGRKWGSRMTMTIMLLGGILLCSAAGPNAQTFLSIFMTGLFIFGLGVGGEYPLASASAAERAEGDPHMRQRRGEHVVLTFSQQGWGSLVNTLVIVILLAMQGATATDPTARQASVTWHVQFAVGTVIVFCVMVYRYWYLEESRVWAAERKSIDHDHRPAFQGGLSHWIKRYIVNVKRYWSRLLVTCLGWGLNDLAFYGKWHTQRNKLFMNEFIAVISPEGSTVFAKMLWTLLNSGVSLCGYLVAAFAIDKRWYGRRRMQAVGFCMMFILFGSCGLWYNQLLQSNLLGVFQFIYFFSSFWIQLGPNCTTWLVFPTEVRATFHGVSAASGQLGALVATQVFSRISPRGAFCVSALAGILGAVATLLFLPDTTGLSLSEIDRHHRYLLVDHGHHYHGEAINPQYLSLFERMAGYGSRYNPTEDHEHRKLQEAAAASRLCTVEEGLEMALGSTARESGFVSREDSAASSSN